MGSKAESHSQKSGTPTPAISTHLYEIRPRPDKHGVDLISDALRIGSLWYAGPNAINNAISFAKFFSRSHDAVIRAEDDAGNVIETHEHAGDFQRVISVTRTEPLGLAVWFGLRMSEPWLSVFS